MEDFRSLHLRHFFPLSTKYSPDAAPGVNFLFGDYTVGSVHEKQWNAMSGLGLTGKLVLCCLNALDSLSTYKIYFLRGISGAGKTHLPTTIASRGTQFVFILNCGKRGSLHIPADLEALKTPTINGMEAPWEPQFQSYQHKPDDIWEMYEYF